jgi:hypothetical protein
MPLGWVAGATLVTGLYSANKASKASNAATQAASDSAAEAAALGREELDFTKQQYADAKPYREQAAKTAEEVSRAQLASMGQNDALAKEYADYNRTTFRPLEQGIVADAEAYDTPQKRQAAADSAMADVNAGFSATGAARQRQLAASGVNPGSARAMAVMAGQDVDQAKALAGAAFGARKGVETQGFARKMDAASLGRGLASNQATSAGVALNAGNSAVNNSMQGVNAVNAGVGAMQAGYGGARQGAQVAGSLYQQNARLYSDQAAASNQALGMLGNAAGQWAGSTAGSQAIAGWISDVNVKEDIEAADDEEALEEVTSTPVSKWRYSPAKMAERGLPMDDGQEHTGPMAQDVNATMGEEAAPGGKKLDLVTLNGKTMLAIQALDKKVNKLSAMVGSGKFEARAA